MWLCFQYLNTVIPFEKKGSPLSVEDLQMVTKSKQTLDWRTNKPLKLKADACLLLIQFSTPWRRTVRRCPCCSLTTYWKVKKTKALIHYMSKVSGTKAVDSVWVDLSFPLSRLVQSSVLPKVPPGPRGQRDSQTSCPSPNPVWSSDRAAWSSTWTLTILILITVLTPTLDCCLLLSSPSTIIPSAFWPQPTWRPWEEFFKCVTAKGLHQRSMAYCYISGIQHRPGFLTFLLFFIFTVDSKLNSDLWPRSFKQNRNILTI